VSALADGLSAGDVVGSARYPIGRDSLVRYAGASGDFNAIHYRDDVALAAGLPGVLAHGMLTMGVAVQPVVEWLAGRGDIVEYGVRFTRPVVVDPVEGAELAVTATVGAVDAEAGTARIDLAVTAGAGTVLGKAQAHVRFRG
jgi:acyl dehydratase